MQISLEIIFFKATYNTKTKTSRLSFTSWILVEGIGHETDVLFMLLLLLCILEGDQSKVFFFAYFVMF